MNKSSLLTGFMLVLVSLGVLYFFPWKGINWGAMSMRPSESVTVTGFAKSDKPNQIASFTAGVTSENEDKQKAVDEVNQKINDLIGKVKMFGVEDQDIKTQSLSIYKMQEYRDQFGATVPAKWSAGNSVDIKLKDINRSSAIMDLLASSGATNVYGPNFYLDDTNELQKELLSKALDDAKQKAEILAKASGKKLGDVITMQEGGGYGGSYPPIMMDMKMYGGGGAGGSGAPVEPGSSTVSTTVSVMYELR